MDLIKTNKRQYGNILLALCLVFQLSVINTPAQDTNANGDFSGLGEQDIVKYVPVPVKNGERSHFITALTGNETINEIETSFFIDRMAAGLKGLVLRFYKLPLPFAVLGVLVLCFGYVINKKAQHKSILAVLLGGHSPPQGLQLLSIS